MKLATCGLIMKDGKVLAIGRDEEAKEVGLVGGKVDTGETLEQACRREMKEECGIDVIDMEPVFTRIAEGEEDYKTTTFLIKSYSGVPSTQSGECPVRWVTWDELINDSPFGKYNRMLKEVMECTTFVC
jgi:ADP-ribose pyrophosphatase YjhB (NUDIX family)